MAMSILDGTSGNVDVQITPPGGSATSYKCVIMGLEYRCGRSFSEATTLCSGKWVQENPQRNQDFISISKLASKGSVISDTSVFMTAVAPVTITVTLDTGITKSGTFHADTDTFSVAAGVSSVPGQLGFRSYGAIATIWVTT